MSDILREMGNDIHYHFHDCHYYFDNDPFKADSPEYIEHRRKDHGWEPYKTEKTRIMISGMMFPHIATTVTLFRGESKAIIQNGATHMKISFQPNGNQAY